MTAPFFRWIITPWPVDHYFHKSSQLDISSIISGEFLTQAPWNQSLLSSFSVAKRNYIIVSPRNHLPGCCNFANFQFSDHFTVDLANLRYCTLCRDFSTQKQSFISPEKCSGWWKTLKIIFDGIVPKNPIIPGPFRHFGGHFPDPKLY